jgi:hypothetical protein
VIIAYATGFAHFFFLKKRLELLAYPNLFGIKGFVVVVVVVKD